MEKLRDLFGEEIAFQEAMPPKRKATRVNGYAMPPGTGPAEETCGSCLYLTRIAYAKTYLKCGKAKRRWTHGPGTDIRARSPACSLWVAQEAGEA